MSFSSLIAQCLTKAASYHPHTFATEASTSLCPSNFPVISTTVLARMCTWINSSICQSWADKCTTVHCHFQNHKKSYSTKHSCSLPEVHKIQDIAPRQLLRPTIKFRWFVKSRHYHQIHWLIMNSNTNKETLSSVIHGVGCQDWHSRKRIM